MSTRSEFEAIARRIWHGLVEQEFRGSDPYDGLNSRLLKPVLERSRWLRLAVIQGVKRSPVDLRPVLRVPPGLNPKGLALVAQGAAEWQDLGDTCDDLAWLGDALLCTASRANGDPVMEDRSVQAGAADRVATAADSWPQAAGWGYDFPWQARAFLQPAYFPTVVATSFVLDALELSDNAAWPVAGASAGRFVDQDLYRHEDTGGLCFSYSPGDRTRVYNASLFGARILAQTADLVPTKAESWRAASHRAVDWVMARQGSAGQWKYGEADHWQWIDNLHTGFNLETIERTATLLGTDRWDEGLARGLDFYRKKLFDSKGTPLYYTTSKWPLDPHSFAQGALTFLRLRRFDDNAVEFAEQILMRGVAELWDERRGGFRFQRHRFYSQRAIHMRWSQAWMFRSLCAFLATT